MPSYLSYAQRVLKNIIAETSSVDNIKVLVKTTSSPCSLFVWCTYWRTILPNKLLLQLKQNMLTELVNSLAVADPIQVNFVVLRSAVSGACVWWHWGGTPYSVFNLCRFCDAHLQGSMISCLKLLLSQTDSFASAFTPGTLFLSLVENVKRLLGRVSIFFAVHRDVCADSDCYCVHHLMRNLWRKNMLCLVHAYVSVRRSNWEIKILIKYAKLPHCFIWRAR